MQWHSITPTTTRTALGTTRLAAGRKGGGAAATSGQRPAASSVVARSNVEANDPMQWHSITPTTTRPALGTTRLAAGVWPLEAHTATTLRHISPRYDSIGRSLAAGRKGGGAAATSGQRPAASCVVARWNVEADDPMQWHSITPTTTRPAPCTTRLAAGVWPLEAHTAATLRHISPRHDSIGRSLAAGRKGGGAAATSGQRPAASSVVARSSVEADDPMQWHSITPTTTRTAPCTTRLAAGRWPLVAELSTSRPVAPLKNP